MAEKALGTRRERKAQGQGAKPHMGHLGDRKISQIGWPAGLVGFPAHFELCGQEEDLHIGKRQKCGFIQFFFSLAFASQCV